MPCCDICGHEIEFEDEDWDRDPKTGAYFCCYHMEERSPEEKYKDATQGR
jgi:hypothetical protein